MFLHKGDILFHQGQEGPLYVIKSGLFKVVRLQEDGTPFLFNIIVPGETIPHHSLLSAKEYHGTAIALTKAEVQAISPSDWYVQLHQDPSRYLDIALQLQEKLRMMQQRIDQLTTISPKERLLRLEDWLVSYIGDVPIYELLTQAEIAQFIGLRRETINRLLQERKKANKDI